MKLADKLQFVAVAERSKRSSHDKLKFVGHFARWRNAILGTLLVLAGLTTAILTLLARRLAEPSLVSVGAIASLVFVLLISILIVPPFSRSAFFGILRGFSIDVTTRGGVFIVVFIIVAFAGWA